MNGLDLPLGLQEVEAPRISIQSGTSDSCHSYNLQTLLNMLKNKVYGYVTFHQV